MYWWQYVLFPFSLLFNLITWLRNQSYNQQIKRRIRFDANVIVVGNLAIGGTGKTPMVDYLIRYFHDQGQKVCTLSRGYGRRTTGYRLASGSDTPESIGDEPYMYYEKYQGEVPVAVCEIRDLAITELLAAHLDTHAVLMDDAMQHRRVEPSLTIMLTTYDRPFYDDFVLPSGWLREARSGARRADIIVVTKCPEFLSEADQVKMKYHISRYTEAAVYFAAIEYLPIRSFFEGEQAVKRKVVGISGMANPAPFERYLRKQFDVKLTYNYRDHHLYKSIDIRDIIRELDEDTMLVTTEKDMVKLKRFEELREYSCFYLPIQMKFLKDESLFQSNLESYLTSQV